MDFIDLKRQQVLIKDKIDQRIQNVLSHGKYVFGPEIAELEVALAKHTGVNHCIACASGTDALLLALLALDIGPGDEVVTTPFTFIATVETIALLGAKPVFVDIDPVTFNINPELIKAAITDKTKAIIPVGLFGQCPDMTKINEVAKTHKLMVIEDAAQTFGAMHHGKKSGSLSSIATTSFFPAKPLGCYGDGGAVFTDDDKIAQKMRWLLNHGQSKRDDVQLIGINGRLDTLQAAILLEKLTIFADEVNKRNLVAKNYDEQLSEHVITPVVLPENTSVWAQYACRSNQRDKICAQLSADQIPFAIYYSQPAHLQPAYQYLNYKEGDFPEAERACKEVFSIPMHPYLTEEEIHTVCRSVLNGLS